MRNKKFKIGDEIYSMRGIYYTEIYYVQEINDDCVKTRSRSGLKLKFNNDANNIKIHHSDAAINIIKNKFILVENAPSDIEEYNADYPQDEDED